MTAHAASQAHLQGTQNRQKKFLSDKEQVNSQKIYILSITALALLALL